MKGGKITADKIKELRLFDSVNIGQISKDLDAKPEPVYVKAVTFDTFTDACQYYNRKNYMGGGGQRKIQTTDAGEFRKLLL